MRKISEYYTTFSSSQKINKSFFLSPRGFVPEPGKFLDFRVPIFFEFCFSIPFFTFSFFLLFLFRYLFLFQPFLTITQCTVQDRFWFFFAKMCLKIWPSNFCKKKKNRGSCCASRDFPYYFKYFNRKAFIYIKFQKKIRSSNFKK